MQHFGFLVRACKQIRRTSLLQTLLFVIILFGSVVSLVAAEGGSDLAVPLSYVVLAAMATIIGLVVVTAGMQWHRSRRSTRLGSSRLRAAQVCRASTCERCVCI